MKTFFKSKPSWLRRAVSSIDKETKINLLFFMTTLSALISFIIFFSTIMNDKSRKVVLTWFAIFIILVIISIIFYYISIKISHKISSLKNKRQIMYFDQAILHFKNGDMDKVRELNKKFIKTYSYNTFLTGLILGKDITSDEYLKLDNIKNTITENERKFQETIQR